MRSSNRVTSRAMPSTADSDRWTSCGEHVLSVHWAIWSKASFSVWSWRSSRMNVRLARQYFRRNSLTFLMTRPRMPRTSKALVATPKADAGSIVCEVNRINLLF